MTIVSVDSKNDLSKLVDELGDLSEDEEVEESKDEDLYQNEGRTTLKKHMILCWKIVANMPKLPTLL